MNLTHANAIAQAVLYEGYALYPYRPSVKNQMRWTFGLVSPRALIGRDSTLRCTIQLECLLRATSDTLLDVHLRFLHVAQRTISVFPSPHTSWPADASERLMPVSSLTLGDAVYQPWQDATQREFAFNTKIADLANRPVENEFSFPAEHMHEPLRDANQHFVGAILRDQATIDGHVHISAVRLRDEIVKLTARVENHSSIPESTDPILAALASAHLLLGIDHGQFFSMIDPPVDLAPLVAECRSEGLWPVLLGEPGQADTLLAAPIILYDHPRIAPQSPGDLFDATEIDEILSLRIQTLTDEEKRRIAGLDPRTRALLARTEALPGEHLARLHAVMHPDPDSNTHA